MYGLIFSKFQRDVQSRDIDSTYSFENYPKKERFIKINLRLFCKFD